jgi:Family of unknown function (DUF6200)
MAAPVAEATKVETTKTTELAAANAPIVVDLGKKRRKQIRRMRKGQGKLMVEISHLVEELRTAGSISAAAQPVIVVVRQKRRTRALPWA